MTRLDLPIPVEVLWHDAAEEQGTVNFDATPGLTFHYLGYLIGYTDDYAIFASYICLDTNEPSNRFDCLWSMIERMTELRTGTVLFKEGEEYGRVSKRRT